MIDYTYKNFETPPIPELKIWFLVELFFSAKDYYTKNIYHQYETQVIQLSKLRSIARKDLRLTVEELSVLMNFNDLNVLRENILNPLRDLSHDFFREVKTFEPFDNYISTLFHEISILKDVYFQLSQLADTFKEYDQEEIDAILGEVHEQFPLKTAHIQKVFDKALSRLKKILPLYKENIFFLRSAYFEENGIFKEITLTLDEFYGFIFDGEPIWGYYYVAKSFFDSAFFEESQKCCQIAQKKLSQKSSNETGAKKASKKDPTLNTLLRELTRKLKNKTILLSRKDIAF